MQLQITHVRNQHKPTQTQTTSQIFIIFLMSLPCRVLMKGITWGRDSHGLFDYESRHLTKRTMKTTNQTQIIRKVNELELHPLQKPLSEESLKEPETKQLLKIVNDNGKFNPAHFTCNRLQSSLNTRYYLTIPLTNWFFRCLLPREFLPAAELEGRKQGTQ